MQHLFYSDTTLHIEIFMISKHKHINCITKSYVGILSYNSGNCKILHSFVTHRSILSMKICELVCVIGIMEKYLNMLY